MELTIELKLFRFFHEYTFFVTSATCEIKCVETMESTNIFYVSVKVKLYDQTEY